MLTAQESELTPTGSNLLDGRFAVFGYVVDNADLLGELQARAPFRPSHFSCSVLWSWRTGAGGRRQPRRDLGQLLLLCLRRGTSVSLHIHG